MEIGKYLDTLESCIRTVRHVIRDPRDASVHDLAREEAEYTIRTEFGGNAEDAKATAKSIWSKRRRYVQSVEKEFGVQLLVLDSRTNELRPTADAEAFIDKLEELVHAHRALKGLSNQRVRISAIDSAVNFWIPAALAHTSDFEEHQIDIECHTQEWWKVLGDLRTGFAEIGIGPSIQDESLEIEPLLVREHVGVFSKENKPLVKKEFIEIEDFHEFGAICLHVGSAPIALERHLYDGSRRTIRVNTNSQAAAWAACGHGIAVLTRDTIPPGLPVEVRPLKFKVINAVDCIYRCHDISEHAKIVYDLLLAHGRVRSESNNA